MANLNHVKSPTGDIQQITSDNIITESISSKNYNNLPISSMYKYGIVKVDGISIIVNDDGVISSNTDFDSEVIKNHIEDVNFHVDNDDRNNLAVLQYHLASSSIHFSFKEKEEMQNDINKAKEHITSPHLTLEESNYLKTHVVENWMHFDNNIQKSNVIDFIDNFPLKNLDTPNRFIVTDATGKVKLSKLSSSILDFMPDIQVPLVDYLGDYFETKGSSQEVDLSDVNSHIQDTEIHMTLEEKQNINNEIELLKLSKGEELFALKEDLIGFAADEHSHTSLDLRHGERTLYAILTEMASNIEKLQLDASYARTDISDIKKDIVSIKESLNTINLDTTNINFDISNIKTDIEAINQKIDSYHQDLPIE